MTNPNGQEGNAPLTKRAHVTDDPDAWRRWPHFWRDDLVITPAGMFVVSREETYTMARPVLPLGASQFFVDQDRRLGPQGGLELKNRVPYRLLLQALKFFRAAWDEYRREEVLILYWVEEAQKYVLKHPKLDTADEHHVDYREFNAKEGWVRFGDFHSHQWGITQSSIDEQDDIQMPGLHVIIGSMVRKTPTLQCIWSHGGQCWPVSADDVFVEDRELQVDFPDKWMVEKVPRHRVYRASQQPQPTSSDVAGSAQQNDPVIRHYGVHSPGRAQSFQEYYGE